MKQITENLPEIIKVSSTVDSGESNQIKQPVNETIFISGDEFEFEMNEEIGCFNYISDAVVAFGFLDDPHVKIRIDSLAFAPNEDLVIKVSREDFDVLAEHFRLSDQI